MERRKKLNLQVKRELQLWILRRMLLIIFLSISISLILLYYFSYQEIQGSFYKAHLTIRHVSDLLLPVILISGGLCLLLGVSFAVFFPQKIAGPIYRIEQDLKEVSKGNFNKIFRLRKTDRFQSLAKAANEALGRVRYEFENINKGLKNIDIAIKKGDISEAKRITNSLLEDLEKLGFKK